MDCDSRAIEAVMRRIFLSACMACLSKFQAYYGAVATKKKAGLCRRLEIRKQRVDFRLRRSLAGQLRTIEQLAFIEFTLGVGCCARAAGDGACRAEHGCDLVDAFVQR